MSATVGERIYGELLALQDSKKAADLQRFFKTGPGDYGEGDCFLGIPVPAQRKIVKYHSHAADVSDVEYLLHSRWHECRMSALVLLTALFEHAADEQEKERYVSYYLSHLSWVNNWDLVDTSCYKLLGPWLEQRKRDVLYELAGDADLWRQRIAVVTTLHFIRKEDFADTLALADLLLRHPHDLMHKAIGWMLREVGKRDPAVERDFLRTRYTDMPRTMLRYAIEKFPQPERRAYLRGEVN
ncbi:MAG: DNA alkylation repair protein [Spirochaetota bacterium]